MRFERLASVYERLSSGQRINRASDDAAGLAVSSSLHVNTRVYNQAIRNINDGVSALTIADQAISNLSDIVVRQTELAEQAANGIYSTIQRAAMDREAQALKPYLRSCRKIGGELEHRLVELLPPQQYCRPLQLISLLRRAVYYLQTSPRTVLS